MVSHAKDLEVRLGKDAFLKSLLSYKKGDSFSQSYKSKDHNQDAFLGCMGTCTSPPLSCDGGKCKFYKSKDHNQDAFLGCMGTCTSPPLSCDGGKCKFYQYTSSKHTHKDAKDEKVPSVLIPESVLDVLSGV